VRGAGRAARERGDIARAEERLEALRARLADMEREFEEDLEGLELEIDDDSIDIEEKRVALRKSDLEVETLTLLWTPWRERGDGSARPAYEL